MAKKDWEKHKKLEILQRLLDEPRVTNVKLAEQINTFPRMAREKKRELEQDHTIWGYTTVIDESKVNHVLYVAQFKIQPISKAFAELIMERITTGAAEEEGIRIIDVFYMNGEYDCLIKFSAPDRATARRYYESLRATYKEFFRGDPSLSDVNFSIVKDGKVNPELERLYDFIPKIKTKKKT